MNAKLSSNSLLKHENKSLGNELQESQSPGTLSDLKEYVHLQNAPRSQGGNISINDLKSFWEKEKKRP